MTQPTLIDRRRLGRWLLAGLTLLAATIPRGSEAQTPAPAAQPQAAAEVDPEAQAYAAALEGAQPLFGLLRLYRKKDQLICELGPEHLDHPLLMFATIKTGIGQGLLIS